MAAVSQYWTRHLATPTDTDTDTDRGTSTSTDTSSSGTARTHLSLVHSFEWPPATQTASRAQLMLTHAHARSMRRLVASLTGVEHVSIQIQWDAKQEREKDVEADGHAVITSALTRTWLPRCTRLHTLEWKLPEREDPDDERHMHNILHTLSHLAPTLTELHLTVRVDAWHAGVNEHMMAALSPLSVLHITLSECCADPLSRHALPHSPHHVCHDTASCCDIAYLTHATTHMELGSMGTARRDDMHHRVGCVVCTSTTICRQRASQRHSGKHKHAHTLAGVCHTCCYLCID